jgi:hypothetical protein
MTFNALTSARSHSLSWQYSEFSAYLQTRLRLSMVATVGHAGAVEALVAA